MKKGLLLIVLTVLGLQSCNVNVFGNWQDEEIDSQIKSEIEVLDRKLLKGIVSNNPLIIKEIMSDTLKEKSRDEINAIVNQLNSVLKNDDYEVLNQYYLKNSFLKNSVSVKSGTSLINDYDFTFQPRNNEMFVSLFTSKNGLDEYLIACVYGKYAEGWKLNILRFGQYKLNGNTAPELYAKARYDYKKGYLVDAANHIFLSSQILTPADKLWKYEREDEMIEFYNTVVEDVKNQYQFPIALTDIESHPQILNVFPQKVEEGYFPMIEYITEIDLSDTTQTKIENDLIHDKIGEIFKGIDKDKKFIFYKAYSEMPDGVTPVSTYGFVKELNKED